MGGDGRERERELAKEERYNICSHHPIEDVLFVPCCSGGVSRNMRVVGRRRAFSMGIELYHILVKCIFLHTHICMMG